MDLSVLEEKLQGYGYGGYYLLESFLLQLLRLEAHSRNQPFELEDRSSKPRYDAYAPNGLSDLPGPLSINVVRVLTPKKLDLEIHRHETLSRGRDEKLLLVSPRQMAKDSRYVEVIKARSAGRVFFWGEEELQALLNRHGDEALKLSDKLFSIRFERAISSSSEHWR